MTAEIHIYGSTSMIKGTFPVDILRRATSYHVEGARFSKAYKQKRWDGRKHLMNKRTGAFPTGLVETVRSACEKYHIPVTVTDHRTEPDSQKNGFDLEGVSFDPPYEYQLETCKRMIKQKHGIIKIATGGGKTEVSCAVTKHLGLYTLFVVTTRELLYQSRERFKTRLGLSDEEVGIVGDSHWEPGSFVTIATVNTLESRLDDPECQELLKKTHVLFFDECHHVASETWYTVATLCAAYYRFGLSGTPLSRTDGSNLRLIAATGEIISNISNKQLVEKGISARAKIIFDKVTEPILKKRIAYPVAYQQGVVENTQLLEKTIAWTRLFFEKGLSTLILVEKIDHGTLIDDALWLATDDVFIPHQFISGREPTDERRAALDDFSARNLPVLISSTILDEGVDVPTIDALLCVGSKKSRIKTMQRLGRGLRGKKLIVVEFANFTHDYLLKHSLMRLKDYKNEDCFIIRQSPPNADLVDELWNMD